MFARAELLIDGFLLTVQLTVLTGVIGLTLGLGCAIIRTYGPPHGRLAVATYVEIFRNTPFLVQLFLIFFGIPEVGKTFGMRWLPSPYVAGLAALSVNIGAYATEIIRAGLQSVHHSQIEAAESLGLTRWQVIRYVVLPPALRNVYPALSSEFVLLMLGTSVVSVISVEELTGTANLIQSETYRTFETYALIWVIYFALALVLKWMLDAVAMRFIGRRKPPRTIAGAVHA
ncbi:MAG: amino acid ABC transporter permease [Chelatococcus sp.]|uniref:amino acid ABC transporter permease n=1 Tax=Chelatococcus sp. TaxID=1953771 RepID=UPI0025C1F925|nr:amino acid ABC transporter permease [Chelatococcus sp.]MBX3537999.1 amino acid ABC transporter permease [Chelatococcus sp.]